jgi:RNA polymerase sigma-70 factor (ECF subfamily)
MLRPFEVEAVLDQVQRGDRDAFRQIVREYSLPLRSYIAGQIFFMDDVDDLAQEVFISAYRNLRTFRRGDDFGSWLRGIARNKLHSYMRAATRRNKALERFRADVARTVERALEHVAAADHSVAIEMLLRCIGRLPEKLRRVVRGGLEGDKPAALAGELMTTVGAIYNLHYRANQLLRECVQKELG